MRLWWLNKAGKLGALGCALIAFSAFSPCQAETVSSPKATIVHGWQRPTPLQPKDQFYRTHYKSTDSQLVREHESRWNYHETQKHFAPTLSQRHELLTLASSRFTPIEQVRKSQADRVLRIRLDSTLRNVVASWRGAKKIAKVQNSVRKLSNVSISAAKPKGASKHWRREFRFGYNVFNDFTKVEYLYGRWLAGIYHPRLLGTLLETPQPGTTLMDNLNFRLVAHLGERLPTPSLSYRMNGTSIAATLSKSLSPKVNLSFSSAQPLVPEGPESYRLSLSYRF